MKRPEEFTQSEELTDDEQLMLQEILDAHNDTFHKQSETSLSRVPVIKTNGVDAEKAEDKEVISYLKILFLMKYCEFIIIRRSSIFGGYR